MKFLTFYFSGTNNTKWACESFDKLLKENNHKSLICSIEKISNNEEILKLLQDIEYLGFAYPIYLQNMPRIMRNFISDLNDLIIKSKIDIKHTFFINTFGYTNAYGVYKAKRLLKNNITTVGYINLKLSDNTKSNININPITGSALKEETKKHASKKLDKFIKKLENNKKYINGINPSIIVGSILSKIFGKMLINNYKNMKVDMNKCTKCMQCVQNCPTKCIEFRDDSFTFTNRCEACMRCVYYCKTQAISNKTIN